MSDLFKEIRNAAGDNILASWDELEGALLDRWPSERRHTIGHTLQLDEGREFFCVYVKIGSEEARIINEFIANPYSHEATDLRIVRKEIFLRFRDIFSRLADACDK
jgi:hypothetical protein